MKNYKNELNEALELSNEKVFNRQRVGVLTKLQNSIIKSLNTVYPELDINHENLIDTIDQIAKKKKIENSEEIKALIKDVKNLQNWTDNLYKGKEGEVKANKTLTTLTISKNVELVKNIELLDKGVVSEIDDIVITSKGIFVIEVKNHSKPSTLLNDGRLVINDSCNYEPTYLGKQMDNQEFLVLDLLRKRLIRSGYTFKIPYHKILLWANNEVDITNENDDIHVCHDYDICKYINNYQCDTKLYAEHIEAIRSALGNLNSPKKYDVGFNFSKIAKNIEYLVEAKNKNIFTKLLEYIHIKPEHTTRTITNCKVHHTSTIKTVQATI